MTFPRGVSGIYEIDLKITGAGLSLSHGPVTFVGQVTGVDDIYAKGDAAIIPSYVSRAYDDENTHVRVHCNVQTAIAGTNNQCNLKIYQSTPTGGIIQSYLVVREIGAMMWQKKNNPAPLWVDNTGALVTVLA